MFDITKSLNENWDKIDEYVYNQEAGRQANEEQRKENEDIRQNQEEARESNEETRKTNELERQENETKREENEQAREDYIEQLKQQVLSGEVGNGIESIELIDGTHKAGEFDTYQITYTDGTTKEFQVYNGRDGNGAGDMIKEIYDTNDDGIVDNAEKVNNHTVNSDVPQDAKFTDTLYDDTEIKKSINNISLHYYRLDITQDHIADNSEVEIPCFYKVGANCMEVRLNGFPLILATENQDGHYREVGEEGAISNRIQIYQWTEEDDTEDIGLDKRRHFRIYGKGGIRKCLEKHHYLRLIY